MTQDIDAQLGEVVSEWNALKRTEIVRQALVEKMLKLLYQKQEEVNGLNETIERLEIHEKNYIAERKSIIGENKSLHERLAAGPFVLVLVDGDNTLFCDHFVQAGIKGGRDAAQKLLDAVQLRSKELSGVRIDRKAVIRIFANLAGLSAALFRTHVVLDARLVQEFIVGFNRELPFAEFVDVGNDKEAADNKIRENLSLFMTNEHCEQVWLAGSADGGYVSFLRQHSAGALAGKKITLVESVPFPQVFRDLAVHFNTIRLPDVFRETKLAFLPERNYAAATKLEKALPVSLPLVQPSLNALKPKDSVLSVLQRGHILRNRFEQRVDMKLPNWDNKRVKSLERQNLCERFFLTRCKNPGCLYDHEATLTEEDKYNLARLARLKPCLNGPKCVDRDCVAGHCCIYDGHCMYGSKCRWSSAMHNIEKEVCQIV